MTNENGMVELFIEHPENVQLYHVQNMKEHLADNMEHPSTGKSALHTSWVLEQIVKE
ncbi:hypothetical protein [Flavobacterium faecale]|uniref:hypothetical protein n=1 Tax=Flavobacterium faecale TaxID=1355330 RepID=UPI0026D78914